MTLRAAGDDIRVLISSYSETAEDEHTASVVRALVSCVCSKKKLMRLMRDIKCFHRFIVLL